MESKTICEEDEIIGVKGNLTKWETVINLEDDDEEDCEEDNWREKNAAEPETEPYASEAQPAELPHEVAKPIGYAVRSSGKGRRRRNHYAAFEYNGFQFELDDPVLIVPKETNQKPSVAIIKDIYMSCKGRMIVSVQWFYRPEETEVRSGANWPSRDKRELFYSFHLTKIPAEFIMHRCVVHFIPSNKQVPLRSQHPGFLVQRIYDTEQMHLFELSDTDYEESRQQEIDLLVQKTFSRLGDLPEIESEDAAIGEH